jgi:xanthine/CO dehydrogenase XdhC/CoxF family maturation factor
MADYFVRDHAAMPGSGKTAEAVDARQCACLHDDKRPAPRQGNGCGDRITVVLPLVRRWPPKLIATGLGRVGDDHGPDLPTRRLATFLG